jgi:Na+-transporting methylmalonyl-CoA/oxaloacetate decarboxylase gamma subunit
VEATFGNAVTIAIVGFSAVISCLIFFALIIAGVNKIDLIVKKSKEQKAKSADLAENSKAGNSKDDFDEIIPIIMAAVYSSISPKVVIRKITFAHEERLETAWSQISKAKKFDAHNINIQNRRVIYESKN